MPRTALATFLAAAALAAVAPAGARAAISITGPATVGEAAGTVTYTVTRNLADPQTAAVTVAGTGAAPATPGQDTGAPDPAQIDFGLGGMSTTVQLPITNDALDEPDEAFAITAGGASFTTTITDDDVTVDVAPATAPEGQAATVTLTPRAAPAHAMTVDYAMVPGTASLADFTPAQGTLTWAAGDGSARTITVATTADALDEADEAFGVLVASKTDTLTTPAVPVTITDDDPPPLVGAVSAKVAEGASGRKALQILVGLSAPSGRVIRVPYSTRNGTARAPGDYTAASGTLTFNPGETAKAVSVPIAGDRAPEQDETFTLGLGAPENATLNAGGATATITIADDDGGGDDHTAPRLALRAIARTKTGVAVAARCPANEISCRGTVTLFTIANRHSRVKALRSERRLGRAAYRLAGKATKRVAIHLTTADRRLLRRARTVRVRAFAVTTDAGGNVADTSRSATLRFG